VARRAPGAFLTSSSFARAAPRHAVPFAPEHVPAVRAFNERLAGAGAPWRFPEATVPDWLPRMEGVPVWQEFFLLLEDGAVRGAYVLKRQDAAVAGQRRRIGSFYWQLSEGAIDARYALVAPRLLKTALETEPLLFLIGMVGRDRPIARLVRALQWRLSVVPFYFKPLRPARFLAELRYGRRRAGGTAGLLLDIAAVTGAGWLGLKLASLAVGAHLRREPPVQIEQIDRFGNWSDALWAAHAARYSFVGGRDAAALNATYPPHSREFVRLRISLGDATIGWAVVHDCQPAASEHFGNMRVGTIVDCFAAPEHAGAVVRASTDVLARRSVDLVVSNQSHEAWRRALRRAGFLRGPSSWLFAPAPSLAALVAADDPAGRRMHLNRGDGDWPWGAVLDAR